MPSLLAGSLREPLRPKSTSRRARRFSESLAPASALSLASEGERTGRKPGARRTRKARQRKETVLNAEPATEGSPAFVEQDGKELPLPVASGEGSSADVHFAAEAQVQQLAVEAP